VTRWVVLCALAFLALGCGDDDSGSVGAGGGDAGVDGATGGTGGGGTGGGGTGGGGTGGVAGGDGGIGCQPDCGANATCMENSGVYSCECDTGYAGDGFACTDVDECAAATADCDANATCTNTEGSFTCACNDGYAGDGKACNDVDECADDTHDCDANATCMNTAGSFTCTCKAGYTGDGKSCTDIDECATNLCDANATCANTPGGFTCTCNPGYAGSGTVCADIDECATGTDNCDTNATCTNTAGAFTCACNTGYSGNGVTCLLTGDTCTSPFVVGALPFTANGDTSNSTANYQVGSNQCPGVSYSFGASGKDDAYEFTPNSSGKYVITLTATWDSGLYVVTDCGNVAGSCLGASEVSPSSQPEKLTLDATAGTKYYIIVDAYSSASGTYTLTVDATPPPPPGDTCADAIPVTSLPFTHASNTTDANNDYQFSSGACPGLSSSAGSGKDIVYALTAASTGPIRVQVTGTWDRVLYVVTDCANVNTSCLIGNDAPSSGTEMVTFNATAGTTYYIIVDGYGSSSAGAYEITIQEPPCAPGTGGLIGTTTSTVAAPVAGVDWYAAVDDSPTGYAYTGGTGYLWAIPKLGGAAIDVGAAASLGTDQLGYAVVTAGSEVFTLDDKTTGTSGRVWRISTDGGQSWMAEDYVSFPSVPLDDIRGGVGYQGKLYLTTHEGTASEPTQIWEADLGATTLPVTATLVGTADARSCTGIAVDSANFYLACGDSNRIIAVNKATSAITLLTNLFSFSSSTTQLYGKDANSDGMIDFLYFKGTSNSIYYVCQPGASPYADVLVTYPGSSLSYGMGFDSTANQLWAWNATAPKHFVVVQ
jgi:hypothetical protein